MLDFNQIILEDIQNIVKEPIRWDELKGKKVLISGINGLIASYMVRTILFLNEQRGLNIQLYGIARNEAKTRSKWGDLLDRKDFHLIVQDVTNPLNIKEQIDVIIHAASQTGPKQFVEDPVGTAKGNIIGTMNLLEYGKDHGTSRFLLLSTREIYGKGSLDYVKEEEYGAIDPTSVRSCYPEGKRMAENLCACYKQQYGINCKIARIAHTYGPGMLLSDGRVVGDFLGNVVKHENIIMNSDGSGTLALTYIGDVISGLFYTLLNFEDMVYNVSNSEEPISVKELAQLLCATFEDHGIKLIQHIPENKGNSGYLSFKLGFLQSDKAISAGWSPKVSLKQGMCRTVQYFEGK